MNSGRKIALENGRNRTGGWHGTRDDWQKGLYVSLRLGKLPWRGLRSEIAFITAER